MQAQDPIPDKPAAKDKFLKTKKREGDPWRFWFDPGRAQAAAAAQMVLAREPFAILAMRMRGKALVVWGELEFTGDQAPPLKPALLESAKSRDGKPVTNFKGKAPDQISKADRDFYMLYCRALVNAFQAPAEVFAKSAKENDFVKFAHLYTEPAKYRGKVIPLAGRLLRLRKFEAPGAVRAIGGAPFLYEGWIALPTRGTNPVCVIVPVLPEGLKPTENFVPQPWVKFNGYMIFLYRYTSAREKVVKGQKLFEEMKTPLLIGPSLQVTKAPANPEPLISPMLLYGFIGFVCTVVLLIVALSWIYRRGDRRIQAHLAQLQATRTLEMLENPEEFPGEGGDGFATNHESQEPRDLSPG